MTNKFIILNKLFPRPPDNHYENLMIDYESVSYITTPTTTDLIIAIIESHLPFDVCKEELTIFDGTACVGGDTIAFGKHFKMGNSFAKNH